MKPKMLHSNRDSETQIALAKIREEWNEWLNSPVRVDRKRKVIEVEQSPPRWLWRAILSKRLGDTPGCHAIIERLVKDGCDGAVLLTHLEGILRTKRVDRWKKLTVGIRPRQIRAAVKRMRKCADEVEVLNSGLAARLLVREFPELEPLLALPQMLRASAGIWAELPKRLGRVRPENQRKLMEHVIDRTGKPHHEEMASLIGAARGSEFDVVALRMWCTKEGLTRKRTTRKE